MSREKKFHELIEEQHREDTERVWQLIQEKRTERGIELPKPKEAEEVKKPFAWGKLAAVASVALVTVLGVFTFTKWIPEHSASNSSSNSESSSSVGENEDRYCTSADYEIVQTQTTIKAYAQENNKNLLYFDWYEETEYCQDLSYQLKVSQEIICYQEKLVDVNSGYMVYLYITDNKTEIDILLLNENAVEKTEVNGVAVNIEYQDDVAIANFEYEGYRYYINVMEPMDDEYILTLVEELLP